MRCIILLLFICSLVIPVSASAQLGDSFGLSEPVKININPAYPAPGEKVTATLDDYSLGNNFSKVTWLVDGKIISTLDNSRSFSFAAPATGQTTTITVRLTISNGATLEASNTFTPLYTDLIVEPQTYTPQTYAGRALPTVGSLIRTTAFIQTATGPIDSAKYSYLWKLNGKTVGTGAKVGTFQVSYNVPQGKHHTLSLEVFDSKGILLTRRGVDVKTADVDLKFYEVSSLYGLQTTVLASPTNFIGNSMTLRVAPYNLDLRANTQNTFSEWRINSRLIRDPGSDPYEITLERTGQGQSTVSFKLRNRESLLQGGEISTLLNF